MTDRRQAAQQALEALDTLYRSLSPESVLAADLKRRADALREALEQPEHTGVGGCAMCGAAYEDQVIKAQPEQEPVAWDKPSARFNEWWNRSYVDSANPFEIDSAAYWAWAGWQAAQRKPLTDEQIANIVQAAAKGSAFRRDGTTSTRIVRGVEAAHGIKEGT